MSKFKLSTRSKSRLKGVHPDLISVVELAITLTSVDFAVTEGLRTRERQAQLLKEGKSKTMNSRHITGHAVDLAAWVGGTVNWDFKYYYKIAEAMKEAARKLNVPIVWGGDWTTFKDGPHFELNRKNYP
jgi:peptidoglycan LD-endopeptidase CwlK